LPRCFFLQTFSERLRETLDEHFAFVPACDHFGDDVFIFLRIEEFEGKVFQSHLIFAMPRRCASGA